MFLGFTSTNAQSTDALKNAKKKLKKYYLDSAGNADALTEATALIQSVMSDEAMSKDPVALLTYGRIYNEVANAEFKQKTLNPDFKIINADAASKAAVALMKAVELAEKKGTKKDAMSSLDESETFLNNSGIFAYQDQDYANAFSNFKSSIDLSSFLSSIGAKSRLNEGTLLDEQLLFAAVSGYYADKKADAKPYFKQLFEKGTEEPFIYEGLYEIAKDEGDENAYSYLQAGIKKFPTDSGLLFKEINHYLASGDLSTLTDKLKAAIQAEPDNISVYATTGNVYDQLSQQSRKDGKLDEANGYFDEAMGFYSTALTKEPNNFESNYGIGQMYYNKAADMVTDLNTLGEDFTPAGIKKYDAKKLEMDGLFGQALPYFEKAESSNTEDLNTVIALKEIYARLNNAEKSALYKTKYEQLTAEK